jgi:hypothetical protein
MGWSVAATQQLGYQACGGGRPRELHTIGVDLGQQYFIKSKPMR